MAKQHSSRFLTISQAARDVVQECEAHELEAMMNDGEPLVVLDVREREEYEAGHLIGCVHLGRGVLERDIENMGYADDLRMVLYCGGGYRSAMAAKALQEMGWTNVMSLWEGWRGIQAQGLPIWQP